MTTPGEAIWAAKQTLRGLGDVTITGEIVLDGAVMTMVERTPDGAVGAQITITASKRQIGEYEATCLAADMTGNHTAEFTITGRWGWLPRWAKPVLHPTAITAATTQPAPPEPAAVVESVQHNHPVPTTVRRVAVLVPSTSASLSDIETQLDGTRIEVVWHHPKFDQPAELAATLATVRHADLIVVARGGGTATDLDALNHPLVVEAVAAHPIPIWTGIGHALNMTETDRASQRSYPTPTAVGAAVARCS